VNKKTIFILAVILIIFGFVGFFYYREKVFSKEILKLEILGQDSAKMGDEIEYTVKYKNNGNFTLEGPKLIFELPDNSLTEDGKQRLTQNLKDIYPGGEDFVKFKARLLGKEGDLKVAHAWLSYTPHNLSVRYESDTTLTTKIDAVPITLTFDLPSKVEKGKEINYSINYFSNIDYPLENLSLKVDPLAGFNFASSTPVSLDKSEWKLATLQKAQGGRITIKGSVLADTGSHLSFSAKLGMWQDGTFVTIKEASQGLEIIHPLLFISQQINGSSNYVASPGDTLHYEVFFRNIGSTPFDNVFVVCRLDGQAFDLSALSSQQGQANKNDNLIIFDPKQVSQLRRVESQQEVKVDFTIKLKNSWPIADSEKNNVVIKNKVNVSDISQEFDTKVNSKLELSQKAYFANQQDIQNSGPIPPKVGQATTYTVAWELKNDLNDLKNIKVKAVLPQNVMLADAIFPESQASNFSFDNTSREIVWSAGNLSSGSSVSMYFQIVLTPSAFQRGQAASLIGQATVYGEDQFTDANVQSADSGLDTSLPDDKANSGGGIVQ